MIRVSVFYPNQEGARFDMGYYLQKHMRLPSGHFVRSAGVEERCDPDSLQASSE